MERVKIKYHHDQAIAAIDLLTLWKQKDAQLDWAVGILIGRTGSSYRKPGAMMLFNDLGEHYGLLSGGCIEQQLNLAAKQVIENQKTKIVKYNLENTDDPQEIDWQSAIGCGGSLTILILPLSDQNNHISLEEVYQSLLTEKSCSLTIEASHDTAATHLNPVVTQQSNKTAQLNSTANIDASTQTVTIEFHPPIRLFIAGAGQDAIPLANLANELGWQVTINESRRRYQKTNRFPVKTRTVCETYADLTHKEIFTQCHCLIIMHHNLELDSQALLAAINSDARYIGILGPPSRLKTLLEMAALKEAQFHGRLHGPCGLTLGGDTPSSVALSILSHCHTVLSELQVPQE